RQAVIDCPARQEDRAPYTCAFRGFEEPGGPVEVEAAETGGIFAFTAAVSSGQMVEGRMDEGVRVPERGGLVGVRVERRRYEADGSGEPSFPRRCAAADDDCVAGTQQAVDDVTTDQSRPAGDED